MAPSCKTVVTGVPDSVDVEPVQPSTQPEHSPVDPHVVSPLCMDEYKNLSNLNLTCSMLMVPVTPLLDSSVTLAVGTPRSTAVQSKRLSEN